MPAALRLVRYELFPDPVDKAKSCGGSAVHHREDSSGRQFGIQIINQEIATVLVPQLHQNVRNGNEVKLARCAFIQSRLPRHVSCGVGKEVLPDLLHVLGRLHAYHLRTLVLPHLESRQRAHRGTRSVVQNPLGGEVGDPLEYFHENPKICRKC